MWLGLTSRGVFRRQQAAGGACPLRPGGPPDAQVTPRTKWNIRGIPSASNLISEFKRGWEAATSPAELFGMELRLIHGWELSAITPPEGGRRGLWRSHKHLRPSF